MKRALLCAALAAAACGTTAIPVPSGEFSGPTGLAVTSAGDRDLIFIANEGADNLRALQLCSNPPLADGGVNPADTCPSSEDQQFVPAPIRVFPATVETGDRPRRLAGVRLSRPDQSKTGVLLGVGVDAAVRVVDARNLVEASNGTAAARPVLSMPLPATGVDVVAENPIDPATGLEANAPAGQAATAFVATVAQAGLPAQLVALSVGLDAQGNAAVPVITGRCALDPVVPRRLALVPGGGDFVYVADGAGDGAVRVAKSSIPAPADPPAACAMERLGAGGRPARSLSLSPVWYDGNTPHPAGELLLMVLEPLPSGPAGLDLDPGGLVIVRTADKAVAPIPPYSIFDTTGQQPMEPISPPAIARDATFLRAVAPDPSGTVCQHAPCTPLFVTAPDTPVQKFSLMAAVTSTDGSTYFVDVPQRRLITSTYFLAPQVPIVATAPIISPAPSGPNPPTFSFRPPDASHPNTGWLTAGVTHQSRWRVIWHSPMPGLEAHAGTLTPAGDGTLTLQLPGVDLARWANDPALHLAPRDVATFLSYAAPPGAPQACADLAATESGAPTRFELTILSVTAPGTLQLAPLAGSDTTRPFDASACPAGLGVVASVRAAGDHPWLVFDGGTARGRARSGEPFVAEDRRFDYPLDYDAKAPPLLSDNVATSFVLGGSDPVVPVSGWTFELSPGLSPVFYSEAGASTGIATQVLEYRSARHPSLLFTTVTGANTLLQADPTVLNSEPTGILAYR